MPINAAGLDLIKAHEGLRLKAYNDPVGVLTVGYGHTSMAGPPKVKPGMTITRSEAERILRADLARFERAVANACTAPLNENQFAALVSFCFNVGESNFRKSSVLRYVNEGNFAGVPARLALWNKAGGKVLKGLTRRRYEEGQLFMAPAAPQEPAQPPKPVPPVSLPPDVDPGPETPESGPVPIPKAKPTRWQRLTGAIGVALWSAAAWFNDNIEIVVGIGVVAVAVLAVVIWRRRK